MLPTRLFTAALFLFTSVSALDESIEEDAEGRDNRGYRARKFRPHPRPHGSIKGQCVSNTGNGICVVIDNKKVKNIPCGGGTRKCTGPTRRPCQWALGFADCT